MNFSSIRPNTIGWLEIKLDDVQMNHLWDCCKDHKGNAKPGLAGNISNSQSIVDKDNWFWDNVLMDCLKTYAEEFENIGDDFPTMIPHPYFLNSFWVNYQKENEFNPLHKHTAAVYSFVVWMKIPTDFEDQRKLEIAKSNTNSISNFCIDYKDILGQEMGHIYAMSSKLEGIMLFFPSQLHHTVYPFYNCDDDRISISGNIILDSKTFLTK